ncbi:hypothetical protein [Effusibacillus consociatus]|uniref:Uncharacterized protein n=1 Tax=Effusibacillus consociatus TaxID=1117041 RepID=A0ABV9Q957_9BACL
MNDLMRYKLLAEALVPHAAKLLYSYLMDRAGGRHGCVLLSGKSWLRRWVSLLPLSAEICIDCNLLDSFGLRLVIPRKAFA